ncbi:MAG: transcriptional regulator [Nitrospirae bacterium CG22_combo_CG10-13_8_21_14_all_44_11]|nr:MAG: transcriptional regulator [Nitrospirae bacterium CG22_combo_CG10-13_8_21_14_all_44_11]
MPEISRFFGIVIFIYFREHNPPHFHAVYGETEALIEIKTLGVLTGSLPPRALGLVTEWATMHQDELMKAWEQASSYQIPRKIEPLK